MDEVCYGGFSYDADECRDRHYLEYGHWDIEEEKELNYEDVYDVEEE